MTTAECHTLAVAVEERYADLAHDRAWYRTNGSLLGNVDDLVAENRAAIREVVRIRWTARRAARRAVHPHPDHDIENCDDCAKAWEFYGLRVGA